MMIVSRWIISKIEELGEPKIARGLEKIWDREGLEDIYENLDMICESCWPWGLYHFW
jgi:hypothetical protein